MNKIMKPFSAADCDSFIRENLPMIKKRDLLIRIDNCWIPHLSEKTLSVLTEYGDERSREYIALYGKTPVGIQKILATDRNPDIRQAVASNPDTAGSVLRFLSKDSSDSVRFSVAGNRNTPKDILESLSLDKQMLVGLAQNPGTPGDILIFLARHSNSCIRQTVAGNPALAPTVLEALAKDPLPTVKDRVARNPATPDAVLNILRKEILSMANCNPARSAAIQLRQRKKNRPGLISGMFIRLMITPYICIRKLTDVFRENAEQIDIHKGVESRI